MVLDTFIRKQCGSIYGNSETIWTEKLSKENYDRIKHIN